MDILVSQLQGFRDARPGMIEEVKEQMIAASTGCRGVGSGQDGPDLRLRERLDQGAVKTLERNGQHLAGQGQVLWRLLGHIAHE